MSNEETPTSTTTVVESNNYKLKQLTLTNYSDWKEQIQWMFILDDISEAIKSRLGEEDKKNVKALMKLSISISPELAHLWRNKKTAYDVWNEIKIFFASSNAVSEANIRRQINDIKFKDPTKSTITL